MRSAKNERDNISENKVSMYDEKHAVTMGGYNRYKDNPVAFAEEILGMDYLQPWEKDILMNYKDKILLDVQRWHGFVRPKKRENAYIYNAYLSHQEFMERVLVI